MRSIKRFLIAALLLAGLGLSLQSSAYQTGAVFDLESTQSLKGIDRVILHFDGLTEEFGRYGLSRSDLEQAITRQLGARSLQVTGGTLVGADDHTAVLDIQVRINESSYYYYSYSLSVNVLQRLALARQDISLNARTWTQGINGVTTPIELVKLKTQILGLVDNFLTDHAEQN